MFYFYNYYFHVQFSCCYKNLNYQSLLVGNTFFILFKNSSNISYYSVFNCFAFFFSLKRFLTFVIIFSSIVFSFSGPRRFIIIQYEKSCFNFFLIQKSFTIPQKVCKYIIFRVIKMVLSNTTILQITQIIVELKFKIV